MTSCFASIPTATIGCHCDWRSSCLWGCRPASSSNTRLPANGHPDPGAPLSADRPTEPSDLVGQSPSLLAYLLQEASRPERGMREALFLTFNVDVGFFETRLLGPSRSAGA